MANAGTYNHTKQHFAEGAAAATPDAGEVVVYAKTDGLLYSKDDAGAETLVSGGTGGGGDITTDAAWAAKGDLIAATANNAASVVSVGTNGSSVRAASGATTGIEWQKNSLANAVAPAVTDDIDLGYTVGSRWIDTTADKEYVCLDNTDGAAVWTETTQAGGGATYVGASVYKTSDQLNLTTNVQNKVTWDAAAWDTDSIFDNANDRFTIPSGKDGYWLFTGTWEVDQTTNISDLIVSLVVDNTTYYIVARNAGTALNAGSFALQLDLNATQYVELAVLPGGGTVLDVRSGAARTKLQATYLGA